MVNTKLFNTHAQAPETDVVNEAGGKAYSRAPKELLAQYAVTGCFGHTYYVSDKNQLDAVKGALEKVDDEFIARLAIYARSRGFMKDMPAFMAAKLSLGKNHVLARKVFDQVIDNGRMLRNFVQFIRSGVFGRKSLAYFQRKQLQGWFEKTSLEAIFRATVGNNPSMADVIKLAHPKPETPKKEALFGYILGKEPAGDLDWHKREEPVTRGGKRFTKVTRRYVQSQLPQIVKDFETWKKEKGPTPDVDFRMLDGVGIGPTEWKELARKGRWQFTRMNLNNMLKHGVFEDAALKKVICDRLQNREEITRARQFPYQLLTAHLNLKSEMPQAVKAALEAAMEVAIDNVPEIPGRVYVFPDVSGSMSSPVTQRQGPRAHYTATTCRHVAALMAAAVLRKNPELK